MKINGVDVAKILGNHDSRFELWKSFLAQQKTQAMAEVGVWKGDFAAEILTARNSIEKYYMIDPWKNLPDWNKPFNVTPADFDEVYREMDQKTAFAGDRRIILRGRTKDVVGQIEDGSLDFAYIDGDHTLRGITIDLIKIWPKIKIGGFIGGDDFTSSPWQHDLRFEPTLVCPYSIYFAEAMESPIVSLEHEQFLIQKESNSVFSFVDTTGCYGDVSLNRLPDTASRY